MMPKKKSIKSPTPNFASPSLHSSPSPEIAPFILAATFADKSCPTSQLRNHSRSSKNMKSKYAKILEIESDGDELSHFSHQETQKPMHQVLEKVVVPRQSGTSRTSTLSSDRDHSSEYETPSTSVAATPAETLVNNEYSKRWLSKSMIQTMPPQIYDQFTRGKRKRPQNGAGGSDVCMAEVLQQGGHEAEQSATPHSKRCKRCLVQDPEDDAPLSGSTAETSPTILECTTANAHHHSAQMHPSIDRDSDDETINLLESHVLNSKKAISGVRTLLPNRAARSITRQSLQSRTMPQVFETDDSDLSEVSPLDFDMDSDSFDISEESDEDGGDVLNISNSIVTASPTTAGMLVESSMDTTITRRRGRATTSRNNNSNRVRLRLRGVEDRVSHRVLYIHFVFESNLPQAARERAKLELSHPEIRTMWETLKKVPRITPAQAQQPDTITRKLKSFQLEGLDWMTKQEQSQWKGGLLGDEMGMGKTIQAVSLIMSDYPANDPSLVVVPPVALMQWQNEILEYTNGKLKVLVYHNTNPKIKNLSVKDLKTYDVIMISYAGLESIHRKESKGWKRDDGLVKENSKIHAITYHRLILDEAHNIKSRNTGGRLPIDELAF